MFFAVHHVFQRAITKQGEKDRQASNDLINRIKNKKCEQAKRKAANDQCENKEAYPDKEVGRIKGYRVSGINCLQFNFFYPPLMESFIRRFTDIQVLQRNLIIYYHAFIFLLIRIKNTIRPTAEAIK